MITCNTVTDKVPLRISALVNSHCCNSKSFTHVQSEDGCSRYLSLNL